MPSALLLELLTGRAVLSLEDTPHPPTQHLTFPVAALLRNDMRWEQVSPSNHWGMRPSLIFKSVASETNSFR